MSQIGHINRFKRDLDSGSRNLTEKICLVVNPMAGAGRAGRELDSIKRALDRAFSQWDLKVTEAAGHGRFLAKEAREAGFHIVAAVGGDGTCHEVVNGLVHDGLPCSPRTIFTVIPFGTGSDLQKSLKIPRSIQEALWMAATGITLPCDLGWVEFRRDGEEVSEAFVNVAGFGANGEVVRIANSMDKKWGGRWTFLKASVQTGLSYTPPRIHMSWKGPEGTGEYEGPMMSCFVANGRYCGGGMNVGKGGSMQDGLFDLTRLPPTPLSTQIIQARRLYNGSLEKWPGSDRRQVEEVLALPINGEEVFIDLDGELAGQLPARFKVMRRGLHIRGGWLDNPLLSIG
jgi:YegS/Rv2252/BmrU family lipid kinase